MDPVAIRDMPTPLEIKKNLENRWLAFLNSNATKFIAKNLSGATPPSVFVGAYGHPKVKVGPMIPPLHGDTSIFDSPEKWLGKSIGEIANYRMSLVRGVFDIDANTTSGKQIELLQEVAMASSPAETELLFEKSPFVDMEQKKNTDIDADSAPYGLTAPLKNFKASSSLSVDKRIEKVLYDNDLPSKDGVMDLYHGGLEISKINRILSIGMVGLKNNRRLVPTKWSISATDSTISANLIKKIVVENYQPVDLFEVYKYSHLDNHYSVVLIPYSTWSFEMQEGWLDSKGNIGMASDFEDARGLNHYPHIAGAYFAGRLSIAEHLNKVKRKAAAWVLREIHPHYIFPVGVWQIREGIREALKGSFREFENLENALSFACSSLSTSKNEWIRNSRIYQCIKEQKRISEYF